MPSLWLLLTLPPLWRDVDAYFQLVFPPGAGTILLHGPLYCALNRVPLWLGYIASPSGHAISLDHFIQNTQLTDYGVFALIFLQHVAWVAAALYVITAMVVSAAARVCLAILFASQPLFYVLAHCVGSETASMILIFLLVGSGLRIFRNYPSPKLVDWVVFTTFLCLLVLTRHINAVLAAVLPVAAVLMLLGTVVHGGRPARTGEGSKADVGMAKRINVCLTSIALSVIALVWASAFTHLLCWQAGVKSRSKIGLTFLWRLNFLESLEPHTRDTLLSGIRSKCGLPDARRVVERLDLWLDQHHQWNPQQFLRERTADLWPGQGDAADYSRDLALNQMAYRS
jgi:hypothetical protein